MRARTTRSANSRDVEGDTGAYTASSKFHTSSLVSWSPWGKRIERWAGFILPETAHLAGSGFVVSTQQAADASSKESLRTTRYDEEPQYLH